MAEQNPQQPEQKKKKKKEKKAPSFLKRLLLFLLVAAVAVGAVAVVVFRDRLNIDSVRRWFEYRTLLRNDSGQAESFVYDGGIEDAFAVLDHDLLICSGNVISLYSGSGTRYISQSAAMDHPVVNTNGTLAVAYDAGGSSLYVLGERSLIWSADDLETILSARLNRDGQLTVVTQPSGYRSAVTVYSAAYEPVMTVQLSSALAMDAALSDDGKTLAILTVGQENGSFATTLEFYSMTYSAGEFTPDLTCSLGGAVALDVKHTSSMLWCLEEQGLSVVDHEGAIRSASWASRYLRQYTLDGDGFATVLVGRHRAGSQAELLIVDERGETHSLSVSGQVLAVSAAGRYVAVLTADRLDIYTSDLKLYSSLEGTQGARNVLMMENGSAILISGDTASFYVP